MVEIGRLISSEKGMVCIRDRILDILGKINIFERVKFINYFVHWTVLKTFSSQEK